MGDGEVRGVVGWGRKGGRGESEEGGGLGENGGGIGRTQLLLDLVVWLLTTHAFRAGAPFLLLLLVETHFGALSAVLPCIT